MITDSLQTNKITKMKPASKNTGAIPDSMWIISLKSWSRKTIQIVAAKSAIKKTAFRKFLIHITLLLVK